jgi:hypothetical protein
MAIAGQPNLHLTVLLLLLREKARASLDPQQKPEQTKGPSVANRHLERATMARSEIQRAHYLTRRPTPARNYTVVRTLQPQTLIATMALAISALDMCCAGAAGAAAAAGHAARARAL